MTAVALDKPDAPAPAADAPRVGRTELGTITIADSVVAKIAARAAVEVPDAGAAAPRVLGRSLAGGRALGVRETSLSDLPKTSATVDGSLAVLQLTISVRWPEPIAQVSEQVRERVRDRVQELTGLQVAEVQITVTDLVTHLAPPPRVR